MRWLVPPPPAPYPHAPSPAVRNGLHSSISMCTSDGNWLLCWGRRPWVVQPWGGPWAVYTDTPGSYETTPKTKKWGSWDSMQTFVQTKNHHNCDPPYFLAGFPQTEFSLKLQIPVCAMSLSYMTSLLQPPWFTYCCWTTPSTATFSPWCLWFEFLLIHTLSAVGLLPCYSYCIKTSTLSAGYLLHDAFSCYCLCTRVSSSHVCIANSGTIVLLCY